ncbi:hypothetical protein QR692_10705 [Lactococcus petauri]|uniref:hypothetical protein n=1 Tax=Lactococcus petauri TaxID=1940789 RepID=UPI0020790E9B|nr:hypothetical protein [Lactococcus petauri]USI67948.1 hypothetical protein LMK04_10820 [Lactococcus petauri]WJE12610.1 hypothetical protein QR692_10705 [Lactococcus petauri]
MTNFKQKARKLYEKGYQCIPVLKDKKQPSYKFAGIDITESVIEQWDWQNKQIAMLARGVWFIDIDTHNLSPELKEEIRKGLIDKGLDYLYQLPYKDTNFEGYSTLYKSPYFEEVMTNAKTSYVEVTKTGGLHIIFKKKSSSSLTYQQKIDVFKNSFGAGVDIKANDNNYCIISPSEGYVPVIQKEPCEYQGNLEEHLFNNTAQKQREIARAMFPEYATPRSASPNGNLAYQRIVEGTSTTRNNDLFIACCYAFQHDLSIEPLAVLIDTKNTQGDVFTREEFNHTAKSAKNTVQHKK